MKTIEIIDSGQDRYTLKCDTNILGRRYDNIAEQITIVKPAAEVDSVCILVATYGGNIVDHIAVKGDTIDIKSNLSQYESVNIGFSFSRPDGYVKGSEIKQFKFLPAPKPDGFVPVPSEQKATIDYLTQYGFVDAVLDNNILKFKNYNGDDVKEVQLSGFVQEQSDWNETNDKSETYIKNKPTKLSQFENDLDLEVQDASTTQKGIIQIATDDDIITGTNETKAVTPKQLKNASSGGIDLQNSEFVSERSTDSWRAINESSMQKAEISIRPNNQIHVNSTNMTSESSGIANDIGVTPASVEIISIDIDSQLQSQSSMYFSGGVIVITSNQQYSNDNIEYHLETPDLENSINYSTEYISDGSQLTQRKLCSNKEEIIFNDGSTKITHTFDKNGLTLNGAKVLTETTGVKLAQGIENVGKILKVDSTGNLALADESGGIDLNNSEFISSGNSDTWKVINNNGSVEILGEDTEENWKASIEVRNNSIGISTELNVIDEYTGTPGTTQISCAGSDINISSSFVPDPNSDENAGACMLFMGKNGFNGIYQKIEGGDAKELSFTLNHTSQTINGNQILTTDNGIAKNQGTENVGKVLTVGEDGNVTPQDASGGSSSSIIEAITLILPNGTASYTPEMGILCSGQGQVAYQDLSGGTISSGIALPIFAGNNIEFNTTDNKITINAIAPTLISDLTDDVGMATQDDIEGLENQIGDISTILSSIVTVSEV